MRRREFTLICTTGFTGAVSGCTSQPQHVEFQRQRVTGYRVQVVNRRDEEVDGSVTIRTLENAGDAGRDTYEFRLGPGDGSSIHDVFPSRSADYEIRVSAQGETRVQRIDVAELRAPNLVFEITNGGIRYGTEDRPPTDFSIYNATETEETFKVRVTDTSSGARYEDTETVPSDEIYSYIDVFEIGTEYNVWASVDGESASTTITNSETNSVSVYLSDDELRVDVGET